MLARELRRFRGQVQRVLQANGFCYLVFLLTGMELARATGVTIITHGYQSSSGHPAWVDAMGDAIAARAGTSTLVFNLNIWSLKPLNYEYGSSLTGASANVEVVIKLYWDAWAN